MSNFAINRPWTNCIGLLLLQLSHRFICLTKTKSKSLLPCRLFARKKNIYSKLECPRNTIKFHQFRTSHAKNEANVDTLIYYVEQILLYDNGIAVVQLSARENFSVVLWRTFSVTLQQTVTYVKTNHKQ